MEFQFNSIQLDTFLHPKHVYRCTWVCATHRNLMPTHIFVWESLRVWIEIKLKASRESNLCPINVYRCTWVSETHINLMFFDIFVWESTSSSDWHQVQSQSTSLLWFAIISTGFNCTIITLHSNQPTSQSCPIFLLMPLKYLSYCQTTWHSLHPTFLPDSVANRAATTH